MKRLAIALLLFAIPLFAQYKMPPKEIADVVDAPPPPITTVSPDGKWVLLQHIPALLTIEDLSRPELKLAGIRFDPERHDQSRALYATAMTLVRVADGESRAVSGLPANARIRYTSWSPDVTHLAAALSTANGVELWAVDIASARAHRLSSPPLNLTLPRRPFEWTPDSRALIARTVPAARA
ncbi:MAG TPA: S9 family peptidase, partial [Thermoanaerobaculia bacterium]|nr:S9 family peptidase [Thermoanaerobaculia bacterium]